jgi:hypothetical protein
VSEWWQPFFDGNYLTIGFKPIKCHKTLGDTRFILDRQQVKPTWRHGMNAILVRKQELKSSLKCGWCKGDHIQRTLIEQEWV